MRLYEPVKLQICLLNKSTWYVFTQHQIFQWNQKCGWACELEHCQPKKSLGTHLTPTNAQKGEPRNTMHQLTSVQKLEKWRNWENSLRDVTVLRENIKKFLCLLFSENAVVLRNILGMRTGQDLKNRAYYLRKLASKLKRGLFIQKLQYQSTVHFRFYKEKMISTGGRAPLEMSYLMTLCLFKMQTERI